jgi:hypothetical protein
MKKFLKRKIILSAFALAVLFGSWTTWYVFFKPHRNIASEKAAFTLTADQLSKEFKDNTAGATTKYINKAVLLEGSVTEVQGITISFNNIACNIDSTDLAKIATIKVGDKVKLQGLVVGYNDLLDEIGLAQCAFK